MSRITSVFLFNSGNFLTEDGEDLPVTRQINDWLACTSERHGPLRCLNRDEDIHGGERRLTVDVLFGAFNYFDLEEFTGFLRTVPWDSADYVQLAWTTEDEPDMKMIAIHEWDVSPLPGKGL